MSGAGRELRYEIVTDTSGFDTDQVERSLDDLGSTSQDTERALSDISDELDEFGRRVQDASRQVDDGQREVRDFGEEVRDAGREVDRAADDIDDSFSKIERSAKANLGDIDRHTGRAKEGLNEVGDEASQVAREMGSSFDGSAESIGDAIQDLAANAGNWLGPIGVAAGAAAATGIGLIRAKQEELKQMTEEFVDAMLEAGGRLDSAAVDDRIRQTARENGKELVELQELADRTSLSYVDLARAMHGDPDAMRRAAQAIAELRGEINQNVDANSVWVDSNASLDVDLVELERKLGAVDQAYGLAAQATSAATDALSENRGEVSRTQEEWEILRGDLRQPINGKVNIDAPSAADLAAMRARIQRGLGTIVVPVRPGQIPNLRPGQIGRDG